MAFVNAAARSRLVGRQRSSTDQRGSPKLSLRAALYLRPADLHAMACHDNEELGNPGTGYATYINAWQKWMVHVNLLKCMRGGR